MSSSRANPPLLFTQQAQDDLVEIRKYSEEMWGEARAERYLNQLEKAFDTLQEVPMIGRSRDDLKPDYRVLPVASHLIVYCPGQEQTTIIRILHASRDLGRHLE